MQSPLLELLTVTTPCPADWEQMRGDDRVRWMHIRPEPLQAVQPCDDQPNAEAQE